MVGKTSPFAHKERNAPRLTDAEKAALKRAEADIEAGRVHDHDDVVKRLRQRASDIVKRSGKSAKRH